jgi:hypothetical protein
MDFTRLLKYKVMAQLKPHRRNTAPSGRILIKKSLFEKFCELGVTGRYTSNEEVMEFLGLEERRYTAANKYTFLKKETFQIRISKEKKVRYLDHNLVESEIQSGYFVFWYRFIRYQN